MLKNSQELLHQIGNYF